MAFSDWVIYKSPNPAGGSIDIATPIVGAGSLDLTGSGTDPNFLNVIPSDASGISHGHTKGKIRTLFRADSLTFGSSNEKDFGVVCMQSQDDLTLGSGVFYGGMAHASTGGFEFRITKYSSGLSSSPAVLAQTGIFQPYSISTDIVALEFEWFSDVVNMGGTRLTLRRGIGALTDFSNLSEVLDIMDSISPITSSVGEGLAFVDDEDGGETNIVLWDQTETFTFV